MPQEPQKKGSSVATKHDNLIKKIDSQIGKDGWHSGPAIPEMTQETLKGLRTILKEAPAFLAAKSASSDALESALTAQQNQEMHNVKMDQAAVSLAIDTEKHTAEMETQDLKNKRETAKAIQEGLVAVPDNFNVDKIPMPEPSSMLPDELQREVDLRNRYAEIQQVKNADERYREYMQNALLGAYDRMSQEKTLANAPAGGFGRFLGKILNLGSGIVTLGNYELGTELFGGSYSEADKLLALSRLSSSISPLLKGEMHYQTSRNKQEITAGQRAALLGLPPEIANLVGGKEASGESINEVRSLAIDIQKSWQNDVVLKDYFSSDANSPVNDAFNTYDNLEQHSQAIDAILQLEEPTAQDLQLLDKLQADRDQHAQNFGDFIAAYVARGGSPKELQEVVRRMQQVTDEAHTNIPIVSADPEQSKQAREFMALRKVVGNTYSLKAGDFLKKATEAMVAQEPTIFKMKYGVEQKEAQKYDNQIKGKKVSRRGAPLKATSAHGQLSAGKAIEQRPMEGYDVAKLVEAAKAFDGSTKSQSAMMSLLQTYDMDPANEVPKLKSILLEEVDEKHRSKLRSILNKYQAQL